MKHQNPKNKNKSPNQIQNYPFHKYSLKKS